jgi:membrane protease YdiL (CAAX protease family)
MGAFGREESRADARPSSDPGTGAGADRRIVATGIVCAVVGTVLAIIAVVILDGGGANAVTDVHLQNLLAFAATWVPMAAAVVVFALVRRRLQNDRRPASSAFREAPDAAPTGPGIAASSVDSPNASRVPGSARGILGWRFHPIDLLWGAAIGILVRCVASIVNLLVYGTTGLTGQPLLAPVDGWYVFIAAIAPVIIAPVIEELFFRGLLQGSLDAAFRPRAGRAAAIAIAVTITSIVFTGVHLIGVTTGAQLASIAIPLLLFAAAVGTTRALTGRIGGAVVAHIVFNGSAVLLTWPH